MTEYQQRMAWQAAGGDEDGTAPEFVYEPPPPAAAPLPVPAIPPAVPSVFTAPVTPPASKSDGFNANAWDPPHVDTLPLNLMNDSFLATSPAIVTAPPLDFGGGMISPVSGGSGDGVVTTAAVPGFFARLLAFAFPKRA